MTSQELFKNINTNHVMNVMGFRDPRATYLKMKKLYDTMGVEGLVKELATNATLREEVMTDPLMYQSFTMFRNLIKAA